ncbi:FAD-dependent oxidoreductase [Terrabacter sp. MAHUQ-38]|uniref:FAD-dependent oxidoreductase n=1 Tax=unclassified Terrabacter TaxID=2630222 RepID=UPI00165E9CC5|nr:FAD-dependent oxidoreductase [Terrabacter sp. MAHUQ-38]MBC9821195.1 FAD-dependent monooxygenase [Terrabacter sp. MAHUQ-38]
MTTATDVLVVGAGPTGLTTALEAYAHGASVRVVDRHPHPFQPSRAMMLHARALECLRPLGVTSALLDRADTAPEVRLHLGGRVVQVGLGQVDLPDTAFPHLTLLPQADIEEVLSSALYQRGVRVDWGVEFVGLGSRPAGEALVSAALRTSDDRVEHHLCRFVAGCDGQSSTVRGLIQAAWRGAPYRVEAVLADVELSRPLEPGVLHVAVGASGPAFLFALGEGAATWRLLATRPANPGPNEAFGQLGPAVPPHEVRRLVDESRLGATVDDVRWSARVPLQHRVASRFRRGPLFLAGDAAHAHSPAGGQGMNNGILDAVNLGWKLGLASASGAPEQLLRSYEQERRRAAHQVLALTHIIFFGEASPHPAARLFRAGLLPYAAPLLPPLLHRRPLVAAGVRMLAQPFVRYPHSPLSQDGVRSTSRWPRPGYRLPDQQVVTASGPVRLHELTATPGVHVLLEREASWETAVLGTLPTGPLVHVHRLRDRDGRGAVGVRPDGYVGFRCGVLDRQLRCWLRLVGALPM